MKSSAQPTEEEVRPRRALLRTAGAQLSRLLVLLTSIALLALALAILAATLQSQRDETRRADTLLVIAPAVPARPLIQHTFELYRRGYAPQILVTGAGRERLANVLREGGLPEQAVSSIAGDAGENEVQAAAAATRAAGHNSVLVVAEPAELLLSLKMARDSGLRAYGSPPPGLGAEPLTLLRAGVAYWGYVLLRT